MKKKKTGELDTKTESFTSNECKIGIVLSFWWDFKNKIAKYVTACWCPLSIKLTKSCLLTCIVHAARTATLEWPPVDIHTKFSVHAALTFLKKRQWMSFQYLKLFGSFNQLHRVHYWMIKKYCYFSLSS